MVDSRRVINKEEKVDENITVRRKKTFTKVLIVYKVESNEKSTGGKNNGLKYLISH